MFGLVGAAMSVKTRVFILDISTDDVIALRHNEYEDLREKYPNAEHPAKFRLRDFEGQLRFIESINDTYYKSVSTEADDQ